MRKGNFTDILCCGSKRIIPVIPDCLLGFQIRTQQTDLAISAFGYIVDNREIGHIMGILSENRSLRGVLKTVEEAN